MLVQMLIVLLCVVGCLAAVAVEADVRVPSPESALQTLRPSHPRLIATGQDFDRLRQQYRENEDFRQLAQKVVANAEKLLDQPASTYEIPDGKRLLATSRRVIDRVETLALAYHLTEDKRFVDRAWKELESAAAFPDWNPSHFLDTAEMTNAFALGYDWLYHQWTDEQRRAIRDAIVKHGLSVGLSAYQNGAWWTRATHNWNQVCNGGLLMGALAIGDHEPELAGKIVHEAVKRYPEALVHFAPDGAWAEGPAYWAYAMRYTARPLAALQTALGTDFGLSDVTGLSRAGQFGLHMASPIGRSFNFADAGSGWGGTPDLWWLARRYDQPELAIAQRDRALAKPKTLDLLWGEFPGPTNLPPTTPTDALFRGTEVAMFRTAWNDPNAVFLGFKAGDNAVNHSNLDLGSFVLDALGERFVEDLGPDNYNLPDYFGRKRWTYYRLRAEGHNTIVIAPTEAPDQDPRAKTTIARFGSTPDRGFATADLTPAYDNATRVERGVALHRGDRPFVIVQDELSAEGKPVWWFAHTAASIELAPDGRSATLTREGKRLHARLLEPSGARFTTMDPAPLPTSPNPPDQKPNEGVRKLAIHLPDVAQTRIAVMLYPDGDGDAPATPAIVPLSDWK